MIAAVHPGMGWDLAAQGTPGRLGQVGGGSAGEHTAVLRAGTPLGGPTRARRLLPAG